MARYAAVDIGSNSVRMLAAEVLPGSSARTLASDREVTRLGASVFTTGRVSVEAMDSVCSVLRRFAESWSKLEVLGVRAVATSAIRDASNQADFIARASEALGSPVEIISGQEEARLIYLGVQSRWPQGDDRVLIMDVGGGSAEFIVGQNGEMREGISRPLGAVRLTEVFLRSDPPTETELHRLSKFIAEKFDPVLSRIQPLNFDRMIATSATAAAIVSAINRVPREERETADRLRVKIGQVRELYAELASRNLQARKKLHGIGPRRAEIIVAGTAVCLHAMERLNQNALYYCTAGVRDGIVADLAARGVGRELSRLSQQQLRMMEAMCRKYAVEHSYAQQVAEFSAELFDALEPLHRLSPEMGRLLQSAAWLHDVGHFVSGTGHHKHSAYIVANSDMPGYTDQERRLVSVLCRYHRKSLPSPGHDPYQKLTPEEQRAVGMMTPLLRIAVGLDSSREQKIRSIRPQIANGGVTLYVEGEGDFDLELWAAERAADAFRQIYNVPLTVEKVRG
jgi:exopolyphosphatase / guanosine-5'-triphosphate,3'-diphosphate pyrophosphatase